jgi:hypothetical protein
MPLNEREQRILDEIERQFLQDDKKLAQTISSASSATVLRRSIQRSIVGLIAGLALMLVFFTSNTWVAIAGFILMVASGSLLVASVRRRTLGSIGLSLDAFRDRLRSKWRGPEERG